MRLSDYYESRQKAIDDRSTYRVHSIIENLRRYQAFAEQEIPPDKAYDMDPENRGFTYFEGIDWG